MCSSSAARKLCSQLLAIVVPQVLAESIDEFHSSEDDVGFDDSVNQTDDDQHNSHQDFDHCHDVDDHDPQSDLNISIDNDVKKRNDFKDLSQERDEDSQSINSVAR